MSDNEFTCINLYDRGDRLGANLTWYITTILIAIKNNYKIIFIKPKTMYRFHDSIFVESLFHYIDYHNETNFGDNLAIQKGQVINQTHDYFTRMIESVIDIKLDLVTAFKKLIFTQKFKKKFDELVKIKNYTIPYNTEKTIVVHLRLDDMKNTFVDEATRNQYSKIFKNIIDNDDANFKFPGYAGQSSIKENILQSIILKALNIYVDYEVVVITNGEHTLPYKTIHNKDESYDLFLLSNSKILIGSMSSFSFAAMQFGNQTSVYYPLWDHVVSFGLTTKYDKTENIELF